MLLATPAHLAHIAAAVLSALHRLTDLDRRLLRRRLHRLLENAALPTTVVLLALYYLRRASQLPPTESVTQVPASAEEAMLAALVTAQKYLEDAAYTNRTWAGLADIPLARVNSVERAFLARLRHALSVDPRELANWIDRLGRWASPTPTPTVSLCHCISCVQQGCSQQQQPAHHPHHPPLLQRWPTFAPVFAPSSPPAFGPHVVSYLPQPITAAKMVLWAMPCA